MVWLALPVGSARPPPATRPPASSAAPRTRLGACSVRPQAGRSSRRPRRTSNDQNRGGSGDPQVADMFSRFGKRSVCPAFSIRRRTSFRSPRPQGGENRCATVFRPSFRVAPLEIRSRIQGSDRYWRLFAPLEAVKRRDIRRRPAMKLAMPATSSRGNQGSVPSAGRASAAMATML